MTCPTANRLRMVMYRTVPACCMGVMGDETWRELPDYIQARDNLRAHVHNCPACQAWYLSALG